MYQKTSSEGHLNKISGEVVHPDLEDPNFVQEKLNQSQQTIEKETIEIKIEGCNYQLIEEEILTVLDSCGAHKGEMEEIALNTLNGEFGTGSYMIKIKLDRQVPNIVPIYWLLVKVSLKKQKSSAPSVLVTTSQVHNVKGNHILNT